MYAFSIECNAYPFSFLLLHQTANLLTPATSCSMFLLGVPDLLVFQAAIQNPKWRGHALRWK